MNRKAAIGMAAVMLVGSLQMGDITGKAEGKKITLTFGSH